MAIGIGRRKFVAALGGVSLAWPLPVRAQQDKRLRRIGVLMALSVDDPEAQLRAKAFEAALRDLGWTQERNLRIEYRWAPPDPDRLRVLAAELIEITPDVILAGSTPVLAALLKQSTTVPMVFVQVTDPVGNGFVPNLARPGGNITGFTNFEFSMGGKWLEMLTEVAPRIRRVGVLFNPQTAPYAKSFTQSMETAAQTLSIEQFAMPVQDVVAVEDAIDAIAREPNSGLIVLPDANTVSYRDAIIAGAARHRLPDIYPFRSFAVSGGLLSYGTDVADVFRRAASDVDRILNGAKPADLPVQAPTKFELVINLKTAKALGIAVPQSLLATADEVIE
jgi:putative tryptophan/tyrosine transport system substrate-binding protein